MRQNILFILFVTITTNAYSDLSLFLEDIISEKGQWQIEVTKSIFVDQKKDTRGESGLLIEISPGVYINIPGPTATEEQERRQITSILEVCYGLTSRMDFLGRTSGFISWIDKKEGDAYSSDSDTEFNDLWLGFNYRALKENAKPGLLVTVESVLVEQNIVAYKGRILDAYSWLQTFLIGATIYRQFDPTVLSSSIGYRFGLLERNVKEIYYSPGNAVIWNMITTFAPNERVSINGGISGVIQFPSKINRIKQGQIYNDISLLGGISMVISKKYSITVSAQGGLTDTSPDALISVKIGRKFVSFR